MVQVVGTDIEDVKLIKLRVFGDERGRFFETWSLQKFTEAGLPMTFVQDNQASSAAAGTMRGLHYQTGAHAQGKLIGVTRGAIFDVAVDIRRGSPTFGRWFGIELNDANQRQLWIAPGLAHGFLVMSDSADFLYKATDYYAPEAERAIRWDDPDLKIAWPDVGVAPSVSAKDAVAGTFASLA